MHVVVLPRLRTLSLAVLLALAAACPAADKVKLALKADEGQEARYSTEMTIEMEMMGQKLTIETKETTKVTVTKVAENGEITFERVTESSETTMNGEAMEPPEKEEEETTVTVHPDGTLVSLAVPGAEQEGKKLAARFYRASSVVFRPDPVGVGDKWTREYEADAELGLDPAEASFEVLAFEKVQGVEAVKVQMTFRETGSSGGLSMKATLWIEVSSGDAVVAEFEAEGVHFGGPEGMPPAKLKGRTERISGSMLKADEGKTEAEPKKEKTIDEKVKDFEKLEGLFTLYRKREAGRTTLYMEIREDQLDKLLLLQATASTGTADRVKAGDPINDLVFRLVRMDEERIVLVTPNTGFRADPDKPISRAVERSFADSYIESYKIEAKQPDRESLLINISGLFDGDIAQISQLFSGGQSPIAGLGGGGGGYSLDREKTYVALLKAFPENLYAETVYCFNRGGSGGRSLSELLGPSTLADSRSLAFRVIYNLGMLPEDGYMPRLADPRVGYFTTDYQDFSTDRKRDRIVQNILRWRLEKQDPSAKLSPPKKPIVFWLDNATPLEYRDSVRDGLLAWNEAFERIGFKDAIVVKQMPDDAEWDHADVRHNVIRWITSPDDAYCVAQFRNNPITGEILNASISIDSNWLRYGNLEMEGIVDPAGFFKEPDRHNHDPRLCSYAQDSLMHARFGLLALEMVAPLGFPVDETEYLKSYMQAAVTHEMGHILGLRHNFLGSTQFSLEELKDAQLVRETGGVASVMDYAPFNISAIKQDGVPYWSESIGDYDIWAIEYGYKPIKASTPQGELYELRRIASRCNSPGHPYETDEAADSFDPLVARFDLGADPLNYWSRMLQVTRYLLFHVDERSPKRGESYYEFTEDFSLLMGMYSMAASRATRYIGGLHLNRNHKGDPGEKPTLSPVPAAKQKEALRLINTYVFAENTFSFPKRYYQWFATNPNEEMVQAFLSGPSDFPMMDRFASIQSAALRRIFRTDVLQRVANNEFKATNPADTLTMATLFRSVGQQVWSELEGRREIGSLRRQLQREHLDMLIDIFLDPDSSAPNDAKLLAWDELKRLKRSIAAAQGKATDEYTPIHLAESLMRINRALEATQTIGSAAPPATPSLLEQLLGGDASK
jgi:hypothetical protein